MLFRTVFTLLLVLFATSMASAFPRPGVPAVRARQDGAQPDFPADPPSCPLCAQGFPGIDSCAQAAPVFANLSMILFNPGAFIDVIRCACTDTFQSTYPQCVDCFTKTDQTQYLNTTDAPAVISGIRSGCTLLSAFIGNAPSADGEIPSSTSSSAVSTPTMSPSSATTDGDIPSSTSADGEIPSDSTSSAVPTPTTSTNGAPGHHVPLAVSCASLVFALAGLF
ncbi:hypothetical protein PsYK624_050530 [Phanerochaete sordida]|uniref:Uncharacterized protein n=1 Tax=Phanerochaete sordida TaxID=48140 RepID=A0A9P3G7L1_9APHY|nr:hypothetical protein PsYK624_050530 [Phanerochaete sordida]